MDVRTTVVSSVDLWPGCYSRSRIAGCFGAIADDVYLYLSPLTNHISNVKQVGCDQLHSMMLSQRMWSRGKYPITKPAFLTHFIGVGLRLGTISQMASKRLLYPAPVTAAVQYAKYAPVCFAQIQILIPIQFSS
jgi:hypothetical protein